MQIVKSVEELRRNLASIRKQGKTIGFVPTMGALHAGHLSLVEIARKACDLSVVSIFVNPLQFAPTEDFNRYPRDLEGDSRLLESQGVNLLFIPDASEVYPQGFSTQVIVQGPSQGLCGQSRPGHFTGVATVVAKLFNMVNPDIAVFGQKDLQQCAVIRRMVLDLNLPVKILVGPIIREQDGLALSSRNAYLSPQERRKATVLHRALLTARDAFDGGERVVEVLKQRALMVLNSEPDVVLEYLEAVDPDDLSTVTGTIDYLALVTAAWVGKTRLIDNEILSANADLKG